MQLVMLGTGAGFTLASENYNNNALIITDSGRKYLIDCGSNALDSLEEFIPAGGEALGIKSIFDIDGVFVTHMHDDHIGGLATLALRFYFGSKRALGEQKRLKLIVHPKLVPNFSGVDNPNHDCDLWEHFLRCQLAPLNTLEGTPKVGQFKDYFQLHHKESFEDGGFKATWYEASDRGHHVAGALAFGLHLETEAGRKICFTADVRWHEGNAMWGGDPENFSLIFQDVCNRPFSLALVHADSGNLDKLPVEVKKKLVLMHYGTMNDMQEILGRGELTDSRFAITHQVWSL
jgi:ribonuclease BN (tRNA processing enzyme)